MPDTPTPELRMAQQSFRPKSTPSTLKSWRVTLWSNDATAKESVYGVSSDAPTPALALCIAILTALASVSPTAETGMSEANEPKGEKTNG